MKINHSNTAFLANKIPQKQAQYFNNALKNSKHVDIVCHESTDRDSANSALAIYDYLESLGIGARIILSQNPKSLGIKDGNKNIIQAANIKMQSTPDTVLCVDFSATDRITKDALSYVKQAKSILCMDHHDGMNFTDHDYTYITGEIKNPENSETVSSFYIDTSAKSTTSIVYRFFEALGKEISNETAYELFSGLADDCSKRGLVKCNGSEGTIVPDKKLAQDKNAFEVFNCLYSKLTQEQIKQISSQIDIMSNLNEEESNFYNSLYERVKFAKNGKIAFVEILPDDKEWEKLGKDNSRTSRIMNRFRQNLLKDKDIETAIVFYSTNDAYRLSIHSSKNQLNEFYNRAHENIKNYDGFSIGGHNDRGGGKIASLDNGTCHHFVQEIIKCLSKEM